MVRAIHTAEQTWRQNKISRENNSVSLGGKAQWKFSEREWKAICWTESFLNLLTFSKYFKWIWIKPSLRFRNVCKKAMYWRSSQFKPSSFSWNLQLHGAGGDVSGPLFQGFGFVKEAQRGEVTWTKWKARSLGSDPRSQASDSFGIICESLFWTKNSYTNI